MGQINLYKIDRNKKEIFLDALNEKFEFLGEQDVQIEKEGDICTYTVSTYVNRQEDRKVPEWKWILDEYDYPIPKSLTAVKAILLFEKENELYAATYGMSYFTVDKYCDTAFAFDFARRVEFRQIKTTTLTAPNSQKNKTVNVYLDYHNFTYDSGEAYAKIKAKVKVKDDFTIHNAMVEIGHSIKTKLPSNNVESILQFIEYVEDVRRQEEKQKIPVFYKIKDDVLIQELDHRLADNIAADIDCINVSELDIIGVTEVFNHNDTSFKLKYKKKSTEVQELSKESILQFISAIENFDYRNDFLNIKVVSNKNGEPVRTDFMKRLIDYTDDEKKCLLLKGEWYAYNDDYLSYLRDSISEINVIYDPQYDFGDVQMKDYLNERANVEKILPEYRGKTFAQIEKAIKNKYYPERVFNNVMEEKYHFKNYDRDIDRLDGEKIELMDLYKDKAMYAVKIGESSAKLSYVVDQSISSVIMYKHKQLEDMPEVDTVVIWIILKRKNHLPEDNGRPDLNTLKMLTSKNRLDEWKKEVRVLGYHPLIYVNYWND